MGCRRCYNNRVFGADEEDTADTTDEAGNETQNDVDLDYNDDSRASVDMNVAYTARGKFVEIQGSAESGEGFEHAQMLKMIDLAVMGCKRLFEVQNRALKSSGI